MKRILILILLLIFYRISLAQTETWVIQGGLNYTNSGMIEFYFFEGPLTSATQIAYTYMNPPVSRALVELPSDVDISRMVILIRISDMQWKALSYGGGVFPGFSSTQETFYFNGETLEVEDNFLGNMYRLNSLVANESGCNIVTFKNDYFEYVGYGNFPIPTPTFTYTITDSEDRVRVLPQSGPVANVTLSDMQSLFGSFFNKGMTYRMEMRDGDFPTHTVPFRIRSTRPVVNFSISNAICNIEGEITVTGSTIDPDIDRVAIIVGGSQTNVDVIDLNGTTINVLAGNYNIQVQNINTTVPEDNCFSVYNNQVVGEDDYDLLPQVEVVPNTCNGDDTGYISIQNTNGSQPYQYAWERPSDGSTYPDFNSSNVLNGIEGNQNYSVTVTDSYGCRGSISDIFFSEPEILSVVNAYVTSNQGDGVSCHPLSFAGSKSDGVIEVEATGGTGTLEYSLDGQIIDRTYQSNPVFIELSPDAYTVLVRDDNGCSESYTDPIVLASPDLIAYTSLTKTDIECTGTTLSEGSISINGATGGVGSYTYSLDGMTYQNDDEFRFLGEGIYTVWIRDDNSCVVQSSPITISSQALSVQVIEQEDLTCAEGLDGSATIDIQGGQAPYTIVWADGQSSLQAVNLSAGDHSVIVTDANGCEGNSSITINAPLPITLDTEYVSPTCVGDSDGSITVTASGGNGGYVFTWLDGATGSNRADLSAGIYSLIVTDSEGCDAQYNAELLEPPTVSLGEDKVICAGQPVLLQANLTGSYQWSATNGFSSTDATVQVSEPGTYTLTVTDENGCLSEDDLVISISDALLTADFLMVSEAYEGDTIVLIDISWPAPDGVSWTFPEEASVITTDDFFVELRFDQAGTYMVELNAQLGGCEDQYASEITVRSGSRPDTGGRIASKSIIRQVTLSPNPTTGHAILSLLLREPMPVDIRLISVDGGQILLRDHGDGRKKYEWEMDIQSRSSGVYYLAVRVGDEVKMLRLVKV